MAKLAARLRGRLSIYTYIYIEINGWLGGWMRPSTGDGHFKLGVASVGPVAK